MRISQRIVGTGSGEGRGVNWGTRDLSALGDLVGRLYTDVANSPEAQSIATIWTSSTVQVPAPPAGYGYELSGWVNATWSGSVIAATAYLRVGDRVLASASFLSSATVGMVDPFLGAVHQPISATSYRLQFERSAGVTTLSVFNRGLIARLVRIV